MIVIDLPAEDIEPHPELAAAQRPAAADVTRAAGLLGWLSDDGDRWFRPVVPVQ